MNEKNTDTGKVKKDAPIAFIDISPNKDLQQRLETAADRLDRAQKSKIKTITKADILRRLCDLFIVEVEKMSDAQLERLDLFGIFLKLTL